MYIPFTFPEYMESLTDASKAKTSEVEVDALDVIQWYFSEMTGGRAYERRLQKLESVDDPDCFSQSGIGNLRNVSGMGWNPGPAHQNPRENSGFPMKTVLDVSPKRGACEVTGCNLP